MNLPPTKTGMETMTDKKYPIEQVIPCSIHGNKDRVIVRDYHDYLEVVIPTKRKGVYEDFCYKVSTPLRARMIRVMCEKEAVRLYREHDTCSITIQEVCVSNWVEHDPDLWLYKVGSKVL